MDERKLIRGHDTPIAGVSDPQTPVEPSVSGSNRTARFHFKGLLAGPAGRPHVGRLTYRPVAKSITLANHLRWDAKG